jgi:hypothetical protein
MSKTPSKKTSAPAPATGLDNIGAANGLAGAWVEVFKAGNHVTSAGVPCTFTRDDLDQMAANHALGAAPAVLGHPKHDAPAYAWVGEYKRDGDSLFAKFKDINPAFEQGVKTGAYRNRSVSVYKDKACGYRVRHVGWLGAAPPAIDGLACNFAADEADCLEFAAPGYSLVWGLESAAKLLRSLRDRMIEKESLEAADTTLPQWQIDSMLEAATTARTEFNEAKPAGMPQLFNQPTGEDMNFTQADLDKAAADAKAKAESDAAAALAETQANFTKAQGELTTLHKERQTERIGAQIKEWKAKGLILPADEAGLAEFMAAQEDGAELTFSKAEGGEAKKTPAQFFADFMASRKPVVKLGGSNTEPPDDGADLTTAAGIGAAAHTFMAAEAAAGRVISVAAAVQHVTTKGAGK